MAYGTYKCVHYGNCFIIAMTNSSEKILAIVKKLNSYEAFSWQIVQFVAWNWFVPIRVDIYFRFHKSDIIY